jgi:predicted amidophosphoribosyltransferase
MKNTLCIWQCGRRTGNRTRICDTCWADRERIYVARNAVEAAAKKKQPLSEARKKALEKLTAIRRAKLAKHLPATELL